MSGADRFTKQMIVYKNFEWDVRESAACLAAHGVSFKEASTVFDSEGVTIVEEPGSGHLRATGRSSLGRVLDVLHRPGARLRILGAHLHSSRPAKAAAPLSPPAPPAATESAEAPPRSPTPKAAGPQSAGAKAAGPQSAPPKVAAAESPVASSASPPSAPAPSTPTRSTPSRSTTPRSTSAARSAPSHASAVASAAAPLGSGSEASSAREQAPAAEPSPGERSGGNGWTAESYEVYWQAYSAARQAARLEGKSAREAQRLGKEAGERAAFGGAPPAR